MKKLYNYIIDYTLEGQVYVQQLTDRFQLTDEDIKREILNQLFSHSKGSEVTFLQEVKTIFVNHIPKS